MKRLMLAAFLLGGAAFGQAPDPEAALRKLVSLLERQVDDQKKQIADAQSLIAHLDGDKSLLAEKSARLEAKVVELEHAAAAQQAARQALESVVAIQLKILENREAAVRDRDAALRTLARDRDSVGRRALESVAPILAILSLALK